MLYENGMLLQLHCQLKNIKSYGICYTFNHNISILILNHGVIPLNRKLIV